jgi:alkylated DNA repair dioxygenase AlkB
MDLFSEHSGVLDAIPIEDGELYFMPRLPLQQDSAAVLERLLAETAWRAEAITLWGKQMLQPRLSAWYGDARYSYSGMTLEPQPFTPLQLEIKQAVEQASGQRFNSVLLNYYRDGQDSMGFHSDDEKELGRNPVIASVSFGDPRTAGHGGRPAAPLEARHQQGKNRLRAARQPDLPPYPRLTPSLSPS